MGWKNVKEHYRIDHTVQVQEQGICIGTGYISAIIVIGFDGVVKKRHDSKINADLVRYQKEFDADPEKLKGLVVALDAFKKSIPVYTWEGADIIEKFCEEPDWPNVTHDGQMMYENTFSQSRSETIKRAIDEAKAGIRLFKDRVKELKQDLKKTQDRLTEEVGNLEKLQKTGEGEQNDPR